MTAWQDTFYIGTILDGAYADFATLKGIIYNLDKPVDPEWTFAPFAAHLDLADGSRSGIGFPRTTWAWKHRKDVHMEVLRAICPGLSAQVYIRTPTNDTSSGARVFRTFHAQMLWMPDTEDKQAGYTLEVNFEFRNMRIQPELI
jgi:hypothetical protein